jgi:hypothetical protein
VLAEGLESQISNSFAVGPDCNGRPILGSACARVAHSTERTNPGTPAPGCQSALRNTRWLLMSERKFSTLRFRICSHRGLTLSKKCPIGRGSTTSIHDHLESLDEVVARSMKTTCEARNSDPRSCGQYAPTVRGDHLRWSDSLVADIGEQLRSCDLLSGERYGLQIKAKQII